MTTALERMLASVFLPVLKLGNNPLGLTYLLSVVGFDARYHYHLNFPNPFKCFFLQAWNALVTKGRMLETDE